MESTGSLSMTRSPPPRRRARSAPDMRKPLRRSSARPDSTSWATTSSRTCATGSAWRLEVSAIPYGGRRSRYPFALESSASVRHGSLGLASAGVPDSPLNASRAAGKLSSRWATAPGSSRGARAASAVTWSFAPASPPAGRPPEHASDRANQTMLYGTETANVEDIIVYECDNRTWLNVA